MHQEINLASIIQDAIAQHQYTYGNNQIFIEKIIELDKIKSDPLRLTTIFHNLIANAITCSEQAKEQQYINIKTYHQVDK